MTTPPTEPWLRLEALFEEGRVLVPADQHAFIAARCAGDEALAAELRALLAADASDVPEQWLRVTIETATAAFQPNRPPLELTRLGAWQLIAPIGEGGMSTVYLAERADGAYASRVALKVVRGGLAVPALLRRLQAERQILASLEHPNIARLLDGGATDDGSPYLVMELVEGTPITTWAAARQLNVADRCALILKVCDAVQHAHRQLVVHRDLKPANILVTAAGEPKLLDFGIATLIDAVDRESSDGGTTLALRLMTPAYASPEQVRGERVGTSTDVYAIGVLLFELLTEQLPLDTRGLTASALERRLAEAVPPLPSAVAPADRRAALRGDLDAILSRALRKTPDERYASVEALADDLRRHLAGRPISARRDDQLYRLGRFLRRNAVTVTAAALLFLALAAVAGWNARQARLLAEARDRATAGRRTAEAVTDFLIGVFNVSDPNEARGNAVTARALLDSGVVQLHRDLQDQPAVRAQLALTMGRAYRNLGLLTESRPLVDSAVAISRRVLQDAPATVAAAVLEQAVQTYDEGDYEAALPLYEDAVRRFAAAEPPDSAALATAWQGASAALAALARYDAADSAAQQVLRLREQLHRSPHAEIGVAHLSRATALRRGGNAAAALMHNEAAVRELRGDVGANPLDLANALNHLGSTLRELRRGAEAIAPIEESIAIQERVHGGPHAETAASLGNLAGTLEALGRFDESERVRRRSLTMLITMHGESHPYVAATMHSLGGVLHSAGRFDEGERIYRRAVALHRETLPARHPNIGYPLTGLGRLLLDVDRPREALRYLQEAYELRLEGLPEGHWHVAATGIDLGQCLMQLGSYAEAEQILVDAKRRLSTTFGETDDRTIRAGRVLDSLGVLQRARRTEGGRPLADG